jgi:hypothetical protein
MTVRFATLLLSILLLQACAQVQVDEYRAREPVFDPVSFFSGYLTAHGIVQDRAGKVLRHFNAEIQASWQDGVGTLVEDFVFDDGEEQRRIWTLTPDGSGGYNGRAGDVVGDGKLSFAGNAMFLDYTLRIPYRDGTIDVRVDDRMYLVDPDILINESRLTKFGFGIGSIVLTILRHPEG